MRGVVFDVRTKARRLVEDDTPLPKVSYQEPEPIDLMQLRRDVEALKREVADIKRALEKIASKIM